MLIETQIAGMVSLFAYIVVCIVLMSVHLMIAGTLFPAFMAAREVDEAMEEPFQTLIPKL
jgi:hypothetical protein